MQNAILIVDDSEVVRRAIRSLLNAAGWPVCGEAVDGIDAIEKAQRLQPAIILMDLLMPRMDGLNATRALRRALPEAKIILLSQMDPELVRLRALRVQAHGYLAKSHLADELISKIAAVAGSTPVLPPASIMPSGGEMARRVHEKDWSETPLGPMDTWSPSLRTMVTMLLANRFPMLLCWGPDYISIYNDAYVPILGAKHPAALGRPVRECWHEIFDVLQPLIDTPFCGGESTWSEDIQLDIQRSGFIEETHFTAAYSPVPDPMTQHGIGGVLATVHEITDRVIADRRLALLAELGARTAGVGDQAAVLAAAAAVLAQHTGEVASAWFYAANPDGATAHLVASTVPDEPGQVPRQVLLNGSDLPAPTTMVPIAAFGLLAARLNPRLRDDTAYRNFLALIASQLAAAIATAQALQHERQRAEKLAEIDAAKTTFFSNISHEFRTPLTLMLGPLRELLTGQSAPLTPAVRKQLAMVHRNGGRLLRLVNNLLDFARVEAGRTDAAFAPVNLAALTSDIASNFRSAAERAGIAFRVECLDCGERAYVDSELWEKIVVNLLANAFKFTYQGEISLTLAPIKSEVELRVRDTGAGIPPAELPRLFERFHRVSYAGGRTIEGSGIGLALVRDLVQLHGGSIHAESVHGQGATFFVRLPLGFAHLPQAQVVAAPLPLKPRASTEDILDWLPAPDSPNPPSLAAHPVSPAHILVVDDNADMRAYLAHLLEPSFSLTCIADGEAALAAVTDRTPDLILADVMLPRLSGIELLHRLRADPHTSSIPVILLSARAGEEARVAGMATGADDYLVKPFSSRELLARIHAHLDLARLRREPERVARQMVRELSVRLLTAQDKERRRIARDLHDSTGQTLVALHVAVASGNSSAARALVQQLDQAIRTTSYLLHPPFLDEMGLAEALQSYVKGVMDRNPLQIHVKIAPDLPALPKVVESSIFRLVQEGLTNILRHAQSESAQISISGGDSNVVVEISDSGVGIPPKVLARLNALQPAGVGISGMRERVRSLDGELNIRSSGSGTTLTALIPLQPAKTASALY